MLPPPEGEAAPSAGPAQPQSIGKYEIVRLLGRGGMGAVYQAFDPVLERDVALKVMLPQIADDPELKQRFEREARAVARMTHPNVVTVFDLGYHTDGSPYIAMELLKGQDLQQGDARRPAAVARAQGLDRRRRCWPASATRTRRASSTATSSRPTSSSATTGTVKIMDFGVAR